MLALHPPADGQHRLAVDKARVMEFCRRIKPYELALGVQLHVHPIDEEMIEAMKSSSGL